METFFTSLDISSFHRVNAIRDSPGWRGCIQSHLKMARRAKRHCSGKSTGFVALFEDDIERIVPQKEFHARLSALVERLGDEVDMILLNMGPHAFGPPEPGQQMGETRVLKSACTGGSLIHIHFLDRWIQHCETCLSENDPLDQSHYQTLQQSARVYGFWPAMTCQSPGYSDIEERNVDRRDMEIEGGCLHHKNIKWIVGCVVTILLVACLCHAAMRNKSLCGKKEG